MGAWGGTSRPRRTVPAARPGDPPMLLDVVHRRFAAGGVAQRAAREPVGERGESRGAVRHARGLEGVERLLGKRTERERYLGF